MVGCEAKAFIASLKLTTMRRFYQAAVNRKYIENNKLPGSEPQEIKKRERKSSTFPPAR